MNLRRREKIMIRAMRKAFGKEHLSRKEKKYLFGKRPSAGKLRKMIASLIITKHPRTIYEEYSFTGVDMEELFCPKCGCVYQRGTGNMTCYPEWWEYFYCLRCGFRVGRIDNSPYVHVLARGE